MPDETYLNPLPSDMQSDELAEISGSGQHALPSRQFCVFRAGRERFCLPVLEVEEVVDWPLVTRVPLGPPFLMGVFNLRGTIIPAVDIAVTEGRRPGLLPRSVIVAVLAGDDQNDGQRQHPGQEHACAMALFGVLARQYGGANSCGCAHRFVSRSST